MNTHTDRKTERERQLSLAFSKFPNQYFLAQIDISISLIVQFLHFACMFMSLNNDDRAMEPFE